MGSSEAPSTTCPICTTPLPSVATFCTNCGTQLAPCPICGTRVPTGPTICKGCGAQLSLPRKMVHSDEKSISLLLPDATIFFKSHLIEKHRQEKEKLATQALPAQLEDKAVASSVPVVPHRSLDTSHRLCLRCHHPVQNNDTFCASCGTPLAASLTEHMKSHTVSVSHSIELSQPMERQEPASNKNSSFNRIGTRLGNYQLIRPLGEGGFAEVYLGEHIHLGSQAAIKAMHSQLAQKDIDTFRSEARTLVRLIHPHIIRVLDFGIEDKTPFLVMDYAPEGSLRQLCPQGTSLPLPKIISYVKQVADALQFAHDQKIIHRDVKPENILLGRRDELLLSDFGIALVAQSSRYQSVADLSGTISYMAPEQIQAHPLPASDQYALGIVTYEWLCGTRPFLGNFAEIAAKQLFVPPSPLRERLPRLPTAVEKVVLKALAKDPKGRFESVKAFAHALELAA
jgi:tRNA A-37 threonylcarbamoyl transferase component Bud32